MFDALKCSVTNFLNIAFKKGLRTHESCHSMTSLFSWLLYLVINNFGTIGRKQKMFKEKDLKFLYYFCYHIFFTYLLYPDLFFFVRICIWKLSNLFLMVRLARCFKKLCKIIFNPFTTATLITIVVLDKPRAYTIGE